MDMSKYRGIFVSESQEHLQRMDELLLRLERAPAEAEAIGALFREAHSMKGMSASMGYRGMADVAHRLEDFMDRCRSGQARIGGGALEILFEGVDLLRQAVEEVSQSGAPAVDVSAFLQKVSGEEGAVAAPPQAPGRRSRQMVELLAGAPAEHFARREPVCAVQVQIAPETPMPAARVFITLKKMADLGEVLRSIPTSNQVQAGLYEGRTLAVLLASPQTPEAVQQAVSAWVDVADVTVEPLSGEPLPAATGAGAGPAVEPEREEVLAPTAPLDVAGAPGGPPAAESPAAPPEVPALAGAAAPPAPAARAEAAAPPRAGAEVHPRLVPRVETVARVDTRLLDHLVDQVGELITAKGTLLEEGRATTSPGLREAIGRVERLVGSLQRHALKLRMMPFEMIADRFPRAVRDLARKAGKEVNFRLEGADIELDRSILDHLGDPLIHILRNGVDHGIEPPRERERLGKPRAGALTLRAAKEGESIFIQIEDDGRGMDPDHLRRAAVRKGLLTAEQAAALPDAEALELITRPGFSTAEEVTDVSGRGVGMDVVKTTIDHLHGILRIESVPGRGSTITLRLPMSLAVIGVLLVRVGPERYAIPMYQVGTTVEVVEREIQRAQGQEVLALEADLIPLVRLSRALAAPSDGGRGNGSPAPLYAVLTQARGRDVGVVVDEILGVQDVLVKPLGKALRGLRGFAGVTIMGDGSVVLILDLNAL